MSNPIKGQNLRVFVGGKCIAKATSCTFHVSAQLSDASTKDDTDDWQKQEVVGKSWDVQTNSLVIIDNAETGETPVDLMSLIINATEVTLKFDQTAGTNNRTGQGAAIARTGQAYLTDFSLNAPNRANSELSCQFTGNGPLTTVS